ncbi:hypothetical protein D3C75_746220 [compost metagenome]
MGSDLTRKRCSSGDFRLRPEDGLPGHIQHFSRIIRAYTHFPAAGQAEYSLSCCPQLPAVLRPFDLCIRLRSLEYLKPVTDSHRSGNSCTGCGHRTKDAGISCLQSTGYIDITCCIYNQCGRFRRRCKLPLILSLVPGNLGTRLVLSPVDLQSAAGK